MINIKVTHFEIKNWYKVITNVIEHQNYLQKRMVSI